MIASEIFPTTLSDTHNADASALRFNCGALTHRHRVLTFSYTTPLRIRNELVRTVNAYGARSLRLTAIQLSSRLRRQALLNS